MDLELLETTVISTISENDPYKAAKELQLKKWCIAFSTLFTSVDQEHVPFFLDILTEQECWEKTDTIHCIKLNRRKVAKKMVETHNCAGKANPLNYSDRYQVACWCCLEVDIIALFEQIKQNNEIRAGDTGAIKSLVKVLSSSHCSEPLTAYWTHIVGGCESDLHLEGKHLYEYGLHYALYMYRRHVEAVEFFWKKIKSLPEAELSAHQKHEIFMRTTVRAAGLQVGNNPEIYEFCISQFNPDQYSEILKRDYEVNGRYGSFVVLFDMCRFNEIKQMFDCLEPCNVPDPRYKDLITSLNVKKYPEYYANEAVKLFMYIWNKEEFRKHRQWLLNNEMVNPQYRGELLIPLVEKNYMETVWAIMDKAYPEEVKDFMKSEQAGHIRTVLESRNDLYSLNKFLSYTYVVRDNENQSTSSMEVDTNMEVIPEVKRLKKE